MSTLLRVCQVYLVTGGQNHRSGAQFYHSSTETLAPGASRWVEGGPLPSTRMGLRGVTVWGGGQFLDRNLSWVRYYNFSSPGRLYMTGKQ